MTHPLRFGVAAGVVDNVADFLDTARRAEDLGYSSLAIADHLGAQLAPLIALTAAATVTSTLKLQTLVLANDYRHPGILAKEVTTLDQVCDGRLELGIGAGWMLTDYEQMGMSYDRPGIRIARLAESVAILKQAFTGDAVDFAGEHYSITGLVNGPAPLAPGGPPMLIAGGGRKVLSLAAREADIVGVNPSLAAGVIDDRAGPSATPNATDEKIGWIRAAAGDRFPDLELQTRVHLATISDDRVGMAAALGPALGITPDEAIESPHALVGSVSQCVETVLAWRERWGITYVSISSDAMEEMAPVVSRLAGT
jgi:probable F420-dependent oxidoreductase